MTTHTDDLDRHLRSAIRGALDTLQHEPPLRRSTMRPLRRLRLVWAVALAAMIGVVVGSVAIGYRSTRAPVALQPHKSTPSSTPAHVNNAANPGGAIEGGSNAQGAGVSRPSAGGVPNGIGPAPTPACQSGHNGGATAPGVTGTSITVAMTSVGQELQARLGDGRSAVQAVFNRVNRGGGICGRQLRLESIDDNADPRIGRQDIDNYIASGQVFALVGMPSYPGLDAAIQGGDIDRAAIPVVGSDAMPAQHVDDPWVWPVATTTVTTLRVAAHDASRRGAHTFALVYDDAQPNAAAAAGSFIAQVHRDAGIIDSACIVRLASSSQDYTAQSAQFSQACGQGRPDGGVDFVMLALGPSTWAAWLNDQRVAMGRPYMGVRSDGSGQGAAEPMSLAPLSDAKACTCGLRVWSSLYPFASPFDQSAALQAYRSDLLAADANPDPANPYTEAAYAGAELLVSALQQVGPVVTRDALRTVLNSLLFDPGTLFAVHYGPTTHIGGQQMRGLTVRYDGHTNTGMYTGASDPYTDPCPACADRPYTG
jgi:ABC-type branched-subunit amino acid transport system substrate-binding protein